MQLNYLIERALSAFLCGSMLSLSGSFIQATTQNSLAGPSTLGFQAISVSLILITHTFMTMGINSFPLENLEITSFFLLALFVGALFLVPKKTRGLSVQNYLFLGLCINLMIGAIFSLMHFFFMAMNMEFPTQLWYGNFKFIGPYTLPLLALIFLGTYLYAWRNSLQFYALSFGEEFAKGLAINTSKPIFLGLTLSFLLSGTITCFFGVFAFMGIIGPHLLRTLGVFRYSLPLEIRYGSLLLGLLFMGLDCLCLHFPFMGLEIPLGLASATLGSITLLLLTAQKFTK